VTFEKEHETFDRIYPHSEFWAAVGGAFDVPRSLEDRLADGERQRLREAEMSDDAGDYPTNTYASKGRRGTLSREEQLAREVARHAERLSKAEELLEAIRGIPTEDPFESGQALRCTTKAGFTYLALQIQGFWYTTGRIGPHRVLWSQLVDWWIKEGVAGVQILDEPDVTPLGELPVRAPRDMKVDSVRDVKILEVQPCSSGQNHRAHAWKLATVLWCPGRAYEDPSGG
jgi:hypothetical protein